MAVDTSSLNLGSFATVAGLPVVVAIVSDRIARWISREALHDYANAVRRASNRRVSRQDEETGEFELEQIETATEAKENRRSQGIERESFARIVDWAVEAVQIPVAGLATLASIVHSVPRASELAFGAACVLFGFTVFFMVVVSPGGYESFRQGLFLHKPAVPNQIQWAWVKLDVLLSPIGWLGLLFAVVASVLALSGGEGTSEAVTADVFAGRPIAVYHAPVDGRFAHYTVFFLTTKPLPLNSRGLRVPITLNGTPLRSVRHVRGSHNPDRCYTGVFDEQMSASPSPFPFKASAEVLIQAPRERAVEASVIKSTSTKLKGLERRLHC